MNAPFTINAISATRLEIVDTPDRLAAVEEQWTRLWRTVDGLIFQSHGWISAWWRTANDREQLRLRIGLVWSGDMLVAIVPLTIRKRKGLRLLEWAAGSYSDYGGILSAPECPHSALRNLWIRIWDAGGFDIAFINRLLPEAAEHKIFDPESAYRANHKTEVSSRIGGDWETGAAWLASRPKKVRQNYRRSIKMLEENGDVRFRLLDPGEPIQPVLSRLATLKRKWLEKTSRESDLFEEDTPTLAALVDVMAQAGILHVFVTEVNGTIVAASINFVQRNTMMAWVTTYDPDFARASPGALLIFSYIQWSFDHGLRLVDLLCGGEIFKNRFATHVVTLQTLMRARTVTGSLAIFADGVRLRLRRAGERRRTTPANPNDE